MRALRASTGAPLAQLVADELRGTLNIAYVLRRPLGSEVLRKAVTQLGLEKATTKMPRLVRP